MVQSIKEAWLFGVDVEIDWALVRKYMEPTNFFLTICNIHLCRWLTSTLGLMGKPSSRNLIENIVELTVPLAVPTNFLPLTILS